MIPLSFKWFWLLFNYHCTQSRMQGSSSALCRLQLIYQWHKLKTHNTSEMKAISGWEELRCKTSCACVAKSCWPGYAVAVGILVPSRPHQGAECSTEPLLDITYSAFPQLPPSLSITLCLRLPLTLSVSISLYLNHFLLLFPSFLISLPGVKSFLIYSILHVSVFPLFPFFPHTSHISPHHYLTNSRYSSQLKHFYLCLSGFVSFLFPPYWYPLAFLSYLYSHSCFSFSLFNVPQPPLLNFTLSFSLQLSLLIL